MWKVVIGLSIALLLVSFFIFCCDWSTSGIVRSAGYDPARMSGGRIAVPETATDIELVNEIFWTRLKCVVCERDFLEYATKKRWQMRSDTFSFNERTGEDSGVDYSATARAYFDGDAGRIRPSRYFSYNYIQPNNGGWSVIYNRDTMVLYIEYTNH